jgi:sucrose-6-phosphate hydrolase SacC (GH32 family)
MRLLLLCLLLVFAVAIAHAQDDILIADFEGKDYGDWKATGTAFGPGPAQGTLPNQMPVTGYLGHGLVNSFYGGDAATGTLTSPEFKIERRYINFLIGGGMHPGETCINLLVDGKMARTATGPNDRPGGTERLDWQSWDVADLQGKTARIEIVDRATGGWGHINIDQITQSRTKAAEEIVTSPLYRETYRPQFHFSPAKGWTNDPNGLVYYAGEYHLFFQHNPFATEWGNMTWGHAVSKDLVHWRQLPNAIEPDALGTIFSGSAVVDRDNTTGFRSGKEKPLVAIYTAAGDTSPASKGQPFTQCIAYSNDRGRTWTKYIGNPVLKHIIGGNRDPKLVWHAPTHRWIMALYLDGNTYALFSSPNLKEWTKLQDIVMPDCSECPDFFEIPVEDSEHPTSNKGKREKGKGKSTPDTQPPTPNTEHLNTRKWIFTSASGRYLIGDFDGRKFTPEAGPLQVDYGANYYAVQTYSDIPPADGRRIQIAWMNGGSYPHMPFNQQMSFPCDMTLRHTPDGLRLYRRPVREISGLYASEHSFRDLTVHVDNNPLHGLTGDLWDIEAEFELRDALEFGLHVRGQEIRYSVKDGTVTCLGRTAPLAPEGGRIRLRVLVDRTTLEVFGNDGRVSLSSCFLPRQQDKSLDVYAKNGTVKLISLKARELRSAWPTTSEASKTALR